MTELVFGYNYRRMAVDKGGDNVVLLPIIPQKVTDSQNHLFTSTVEASVK